MSRDYASKPAPRKSSAATPARPRREHKPAKRPKPARTPSVRSQAGGLSLRWIFSLAAVGGFIGFIVYLNSLPPSEQAKQPLQAPPQQQQTESRPQPTQPKPKPQVTEDKKQAFRFYEMLPDSEVIPPKVEEYTPGPTRQSYRYIVQTGSFRKQEDAERQRAQIAFQGMRASISRIDLDNGSTWFRVNVGPFDSRSRMNSAVDKLVGLNIQPLVRKIPKEG